MDARSRGFDAERLPELIRSVEGVEPEILYLDCSGTELIRRYDETRRRHPLAPDRPAEDGIARERQLTMPLRNAADSVLDTTDLSPAELRDELQRRYGGDSDQPVLTIASFASPAAFRAPPTWSSTCASFQTRIGSTNFGRLPAPIDRFATISPVNRPGARRWTASNRFSSTGFPATGPRAKVT